MTASLIFLAGVAQLVLVVASLAIPRVLGWRQELARLRPLTRQVFWTYAGYIWVTNLAFALVSVLMPAALAGGSPLAAAVTGFITLYWAARVAIQFVYFDRADLTLGRELSGGAMRAAETALVVLFVGLALVYGAATLVNLGWLRRGDGA
ncbi:MAG: hypothetical protein R3C10_19755 [Pirellulales bacterium]